MNDISNDQFLEALSEERQKFTKSDEGKILTMVEELIRRGVYPKETVAGNSNTVLDMVHGWGAHWHAWKGPLECLHCKSDLRDHEYGPPFKREVGHSNGDSVTYFTCPDCGKTIPR